MKWILIVWLGTIDNRATHEVLPDLNTCLQRKARLEYYLAQVHSKLRVDCVQQQ